MAVSLATIAWVALQLLGLLIPLASTGAEKIKYENLKSEIQANGASVSNVMSILTDIYNKLQGSSSKTRTSVVNQLSRIGNYFAQSSGLPEQLVNRVKENLSNVANKIEGLKAMGDIEQSAAADLTNAYSLLPDEEKAKARKTDWKAMAKDPRAKKKATAWFGKPEITNAAELQNEYSTWDVDTEGGRIGKKAEDKAKQAAEYYKKANALGEQYV